MNYQVFWLVMIMKAERLTTFSILGGDKRMLFLARSLCGDGKRVLLGGFDNLKSLGAPVITDVGSAVRYADAVIFPLPCVRADGSLNTVFSDGSVFLTEEEQQAVLRTPVFTSMKERLVRAYPSLKAGMIYDYAAREDFAVRNALPTAEGAIERAMNAYEGTIAGSRSLVVGFGRIGKALTRLLKALGSEVTVAARSEKDLAEIETLGCAVVVTGEISSVKGFDLVFNTVPFLIFDRELLSKTDENTLIIDLASLPGGVDMEAASALGIDAQRALSLPGKCAPKTAAEIIKRTVYATDI